MKDYSEEYYFLIQSGSNHPMLQYARGGGYSMEVFSEKKLDISEKRTLCFRKPIPRKPVLADYNFLGENCPVVSERFKNLLESFELKDIQFLPAIVQDKDGVEHDGYYILHICNLIPCMDKEKSKWTPSDTKPGKAYEIEELILNNEALDEIPSDERLVFALWENILKVFFHKSVVDKILETNMTGLKAYRLKGWNPSAPFLDDYFEQTNI